MKLYRNIETKEVSINNGKENIPSDWTCKNLESLGFLGRGKSKHRPRNDPQLFGGKYPFIQTAEVKEASLWLNKLPNKFYSDFGLKQSKLWDEGTLCITIAANIAESSILTYKACFPDSVLGFIPNSETNSVFVKYQIDALKTKMKNSSKGSAQDNLNLDKINLFKLPIPKLEEQSAIASILSSQESIISKTKDLITNLDKRNQFMMDELLSGRLRVKEENGQPVFYKNAADNWQTVKMNGEDVDIPKDWSKCKINNKFLQKNKSKIKAGDGKKEGLYPFYNCSEEQTLYINNFLLDEEVLFLSTGGKPAIHYSNSKSSYSTDVWSISFNSDLTNKFVYYYLQNYKQLLENCFKGAALKHLNKNDFANTEVRLMRIEEQSLLVLILDQLFNERKKYEDILKKEEQTFTFLLEELMSGRLRVEV